MARVRTIKLIADRKAMRPTEAQEDAFVELLLDGYIGSARNRRLEVQAVLSEINGIEEQAPEPTPAELARQELERQIAELQAQLKLLSAAS